MYRVCWEGRAGGVQDRARAWWTLARGARVARPHADVNHIARFLDQHVDDTSTFGADEPSSSRIEPTTALF